MKLLIITQKIDLDDDILGFTHTWVAKLAEKVERLYVLALWVGRYNLPDNVEVYSIGKEKGAGKLKKFMNFNKVVSRIVLSRRVDGIFIHMCSLYAILAAPYTKLTGTPMVMWYTHKSVNLTLKVAHLLVDKVLTASEESFRLKSRKKIVTGHGIDTDFFKPAGKNHSFNNKKKILSVGRVSPIKDYETLIEAANLLINSKGIKDIEFLIVGDIGTLQQKSYLEKLKSLVEKYNLKEFVQFIGSVPYHKVVRFYHNCDVFLNFCPTGGLDKAVLEAMSCERLVLTSNVAFKRLLGNLYHNLIFEKGNGIELANKILSLLNLDIKETEKIRKSLRNIVVKNHSVEGLMEKLVEVLRK